MDVFYLKDTWILIAINTNMCLKQNLIYSVYVHIKLQLHKIIMTESDNIAQNWVIVYISSC